MRVPRFSGAGVSAAERKLLPEGRLAGPMPWVIAIMMFLTVLVAAGGLALGSAAEGFQAGLAGRMTVQVVEANPDERDRQAAAAIAELERLPGVEDVHRLSEDEIGDLLEPWLGVGGIEADLPMPALIDVDLSPVASRRIDRIAQAVRAVAPAARVDRHSDWLAPLASLLSSLRWLALALVLLMAGATAATVVLAARGSLNTHRATIEVLHLMGSTDRQVAHLFQRRIALDALFGGALGFVAAVGVILLLGRRISGVGAGLLGSVTLPPLAWVLLLALPIAGVLLATVAARLSILVALRKLL